MLPKTIKICTNFHLEIKSLNQTRRFHSDQNKMALMLIISKPKLFKSKELWVINNKIKNTMKLKIRN